MAIVSLGIDPGVDGAVAVFSGRRLVDVWSMPCKSVKFGRKYRREVDQDLLWRYLSNEPFSLATQAYLEKVSARPGQGVTSMFSFGVGLGRVEGLLAAFEIDVVYVYPQVWTRAMNIWDKDHAVRIAGKQWPEHYDTFHEGSKTRCGGKADAALIGLYGLTHGR